MVFSVLGPVLAVIVALIAGGVLILVTGHDPIAAYRAMFSGAFSGKRAIAETLLYTAPL
jgi:simple sugar transport system permease protein